METATETPGGQADLLDRAGKKSPAITHEDFHHQSLDLLDTHQPEIYGVQGLKTCRDALYLA